MLEKNDIKGMVKVLFKKDVTPKQIEIIKSILFGNTDTVITAYTRYGKSFAVSIGVVLYLLFYPGKKVNLIAPQSEQANILRNYIAEFLLANRITVNLLDLEVVKEERIKKEVSRKRMTFRNGCELRVMSAEGSGNRLMGWGADLVVLDEDCLISYEVYKQKILRMKGDSPDAKIVHIGNPWNRDNQMYEAWINPKIKNIHIDIDTGIQEGRHGEKFKQEMLDEFGGESMEYTILYKAEFPEESEDQLIKKDWIDKAIDKKFSNVTFKQKVHGLDVAEMGMDITVLTSAWNRGNLYEVYKIESWSKTDTMPTVGKTRKLIGKDEHIKVDAIGVGSGVASRLKEMEYNCTGVKVGEGIKDTVPEFLNKKAQHYWRLKKLFEEGKISIPKNRKLINELTKIKYTHTSGGKIKILSHEDKNSVLEKSPDYADSLMLCCCEEDDKIFIDGEFV